MNKSSLVCHIHPTYLGLSETFVHRFLNNLTRWKSCVLTGHIQNAAIYGFGRRYEVAAVGADAGMGFRIWAKLVRSCTPTVGEYFAIHAGYSQALMQKKPALLHAHFGSTGWFALPLHRLHRLPLVVSFHGYDASALLRQEIWRSRYQDLFAAAHAITTPSHHVAARLAAAGCPPEKLRLLRCGIDTTEWSFCLPTANPQKMTVDVLMVCRLVEKKGVLDAIRAIDMARQVEPRICLQIAGEGEMMQVVAETIERQGLQHHIHLLGFVPNEKVRELMRTSDVLLVASRTATNGDEEGLPTVLIEAAATGLPIVATDHAGAGELVEDGVSGFLVAEGAPHQLAERLIALAENPVLRQRFATAARGKVEHEFDLADAVARLEAIYDEACLPTQERTPVKTLSVGLRRE